MNSARAKAATLFLAGLVLGAAAGSWGQRALFRRFVQRGPDPKRMAERLGRGLGLDEKQKTAVAAALEARKLEVETLKKETFSRLDAIRLSTDADLRKILTPAQSAKFDAIRRGRKLRVNWEAPDGPPVAAPAP
jgi:hypothetical protein